MAAEVRTVRYRVDGMSCSSCERKIEAAVGRLPGVREVRASAPLAEAVVTFEPRMTDSAAILEAIRKAGYSAGESAVPTAAAGPATLTAPKFLGIALAIAAIFLIVRATVGFNFIPAVSQSMGYGLIFVVGLLTSLHCLAMCGGISLTQTVPTAAGCAPAAGGRGSRLVSSLQYNGGRVVSYTLLGGAVGALGSVFSLSATVQGALPAVAGVFMLFIGLRTAGIFPRLSRLRLRLPGLAGRLKLAAGLRRRGPFFVGLLNGLMPCGPLQTMQVYALGTGSLLAGAFSMFLFSLGTVPLMFGFGAVSSLLSARFNRGMLRVSGVLVMVLGLVMLTRGMSLLGVALPSLPAVSAGGAEVAVATLADGRQLVSTGLESGRYYPFVVQAGVPVRWTITARAEDLNGCNNPITIPQYGIRRQLVPGENVIEFTPEREGTIVYTCWMGMIYSTIRVVPDLSQVAARDLQPADPPDVASAFPPGAGLGSCCAGSASGPFAGGRIPADRIEVARLEGGGQLADVRVDGQGYSPAVVVLQRGIPGKVRFVVENLSSCTAIVEFPAYNGGLDLARGQTETPYLEVVEDFTFRCGHGMLNGYVKVVDDLAAVDLAAIRREVESYRASAAGGCCGG